MSETFPKMEIITGVASPRRPTTENFKRGCVRINLLSNARTVLSRIDHRKATTLNTCISG
jgi:hypothetical protein